MTINYKQIAWIIQLINSNDKWLSISILPNLASQTNFTPNIIKQNNKSNEAAKSPVKYLFTCLIICFS